MAHPALFEQPVSSTLADIAASTKIYPVDVRSGNQEARGLTSPEARTTNLPFFDNPRTWCCAAPEFAVRRDTLIGEGTKIDNQVRIGHNVTIGRHCLLAARVGLAGNSMIGDRVAQGAKLGVNNHVKIGDGVQVAATSGEEEGRK